MKKTNEMVEVFAETLVKVTVEVENEKAKASTVEIGKADEFDTLRTKAYNRAMEYIGCECAPVAESLPIVFTDETDEKTSGSEESDVPTEENVPVEGTSVEEPVEAPAEKDSTADEEEDPFAFLDDAFNEESNDESATAAEPAPAPAESTPEPEEESAPEEEPAPAPKKRGRPRKVVSDENGMTKEKALATVIKVTEEATNAFRELEGMTMQELLDKKPDMAKIMIRDHIKPQLSKETILAAEFLAK